MSEVQEARRDAAPQSPRAWPAAELAAFVGLPSPSPEQVQIIEAGLDPVLVVAGAGSGKTETMANRVVWLLANEVVEPQQVLGLTFTRKAAGELSRRIMQRITDFRSASAGHSLDLLDRPTVSTYNSFADQIARENAVLLGRDPDSVVLSEAAAWQIARRVVLGSKDERLAELDRSPTTIIAAVLRIARAAADNLADLDDVARLAEEFQRIRELPSERGRATLAPVLKAAGTVAPLHVLTDLARRYDDEKRRRGVIDFADQVADAVRVVERFPRVRAATRERFRAVLLDEYQDTSVVQTRLLSTLFGGTGVMAVGDPHQAIYGWRGASASNLEGFHRDFASGCGGADGVDADDAGADVDAGAVPRQALTLSLSTSWRNDERVLEVANTILAPLNAATSVPLPELRPRPGAGRGSVEVEFLGDAEQEAAHVAEWMRRRLGLAGDAAASAGGESARTAAILFRTKRTMARFAEALRVAGVPHRVLGLGGLLTLPEIVDVVCALRVMHDPDAGSALIRLLVGPRWRIGLRDVRALRDIARRLAATGPTLQMPDEQLQARLRASTGGDEAFSLIDALDFVAGKPADHGWLAELSPEARVRLAEAGDTFARLRRAAALPIAELIGQIERELLLDIELGANAAGGVRAGAATAQLRAFVDEISAFLAADEDGTLSSVLAWLDHVAASDELQRERSEEPDEGTVQLLTIHAAKGLEWDAVAVVRLVEDEFPSKPSGSGWVSFGELPYEQRGDSAVLPVLPWRTAQTQQAMRDALVAFEEANKERAYAEERRLAYVAVTRPKTALLLSGSSWGGQKRPRVPSRYLEALRGAVPEMVLPAPDVEPERPEATAPRTMTWPGNPLEGREDAVLGAAALVGARIDAAAQPGAVATPLRADIALLLAERDARKGAVAAPPARVPASRFKDFVTDPAAVMAEIARPMPERPYRQTRLGTLFHAWVERRSGLVGSAASLDATLWDSDEEQATRDGGALAHADADDLGRLRATFGASEWAPLQPLEVETEINFVLGADIGDSTGHIVICKIDAAYRREDRGGRIEIVDWKTGVAPTSQREIDDRMLQLALYRLAYHKARGVPLEQIDVVLYYVADDRILRSTDVVSEAELVTQWRRAMAAASEF
ncbi:MAG: UvrD-helicase domain-containing protein [Microbacteriaceae bacterium]|jgi:DNA helicase-2/ATP-dependent DNA helicase PcrA|nr:UvrD-helicase domain-containing protein [Microbacteriaceae bacterium]HOA86013.1 UvrD-helicase domain-containing protein [Microbacteriaceae bacterium]HPZ33792.1 UvrD-helicase domain-containing protein [Microbacteriaceae bacterium]HQC93170.1 UvrD-helicase domain-containing protein [Microbacteriaceae bacterium]